MPEVKWLAVLASGISNMVIGYIWYGPLFGKTFSRLAGFDNMDPGKRAELMKSVGQSYAFSFIGALITAYILSHLIRFSESFGNAQGLSTGLMTAFWVWLGFVVPVTFSNVIWESKPKALWYLNVGYNLVSLLVMGAILAVWR